LDNSFDNQKYIGQSKAAIVRAMLMEEHGTSLAEVMQATGWKACSCRAFLTALRTHRRYKLLRSKVTGVSRYHLEMMR
jgi:hypothetical protein